MTTKYRDTLYANYHTNQSGRAALTDARQLFEREKRQFEREILPLFSLVNRDAKIFDLGCGSGSLLMALSQAGFTNASGMDLSIEQVNRAHNYGVMTVQQGDAMGYLKGSVETFDVITGMDIIEHFTKDELVELILLIRSKLAVGGQAIFRTPNMDAPISTAFAIGDFTHENYLNASSAEQLMMSCGFDAIGVLPSSMKIENPIKELIRKLVWPLVVLQLKLQLFATARSTRKVLFTPNLIILGKKK